VNWEAIQGLAAVRGGDAAERLSPVENPPRTVAPVAPGPDAPGGFGGIVASGLGEVNRELLASQADLQQLAVGNVENLHQIMIRLEENRLSFQLLMQVRNRVLEAYQDVMRMQL